MPKPFSNWLSRKSKTELLRFNNPARYERSVRYHRQLHLATPQWLTKQHRKAIRKIYKKAEEDRKFGMNSAVDHIVPLQSDYVCGLHVPWNLEVKSASANSAKRNHYWPDCPWENHDWIGHETEPHQLTLW